MKCKYCNSKRSTPYGRVVLENEAYSKNSELRRCEECGTIWVYPYPNEKKLSKIYSGTYHYSPSKFADAVISFFFKRELSSDFSKIRKYKSRGRVLDVGAGRGDFLLKFSSEKWERWAYDPFLSKEDVKLLKKKIGPNVNNYNNLSSYPKNKFDVVILRNIIEHTTETKGLLKEVYGILRQDGILFIRTPNIGSLDWKIFKTNWYVVRMPGHVVFWDPKTITRVLELSKFITLEASPTPTSSPLSLSRSVFYKGKNKFQQLLPLFSILYSLYSSIHRNGGDMTVIAKK